MDVDAFAIAMISGFLEFAPEGASFAPDPFQAKLVLIVLAVVFALIVQIGAPKWSQLPEVSGEREDCRRDFVAALVSCDRAGSGCRGILRSRIEIPELQSGSADGVIGQVAAACGRIGVQAREDA